MDIIYEDEVFFVQKIIMKKVDTGADIKIIQYDTFATDCCSNIIDFKNILETTHFKEKIDTNIIIINIEKDEKRYTSAVNELKKISIGNFVHLKATYWKEKEKFVNDMGLVIDFLKQFNPKICSSELTMNIFSEFNDKNISIQDGPLACYCSHVRAMMYGYLNFKDYTIICEDDVSITNTYKIEHYIQQIPNDWDIIFLNAAPLNVNYSEPWYKFTNTFHSTHFYIIKNKCLPIIFENIYPIVDQIDTLIAKLHDRLNIYNIVDTVYQKKFSTNTQNNLHTIFNSPNYEPIREYLNEIKELFYSTVNNQLSNNDPIINENLTSTIISDVIYEYVSNNTSSDIHSQTNNNNMLMRESLNLLKSNRLYELIYIFTSVCVKGINITHKTCELYKNMNTILDCFVLHNTFDSYYNEQIQALSYGSTSNIYKIKNNDVIIKVYNEKLRWTINGHDTMLDIFNKELLILQKLKGIPNVPQLIDYDEDKYMLKMSYLGISLWDKFVLPEDWKKQLCEIFHNLTNNNILYPEFNLKNIVVLDGKLSLIDFGLSLFSENTTTTTTTTTTTNNDNYNIFIELLEILNDKFKELHTTEQIQLLYLTFIQNLKMNKQYIGNIF